MRSLSNLLTLNLGWLFCQIGMTTSIGWFVGDGEGQVVFAAAHESRCGPTRRCRAQAYIFCTWGEADPRPTCRAERCLLCPNGSHINQFRHRQSIIDLDAEISRGALNFRMAQ